MVMKKVKKDTIKQLVFIIIALVAINFAGSFVFKRFDLTQDKRYTLSQTSLDIIKQIDEPVYVDVFLEGKFPGEFKRLQTETRQLLEEFKAYNSNIIFQFVNPLEEEDNREEIMMSFYERGLTPLSITVEDRGKQTQEIVYPWAIATYKDRSSKIPLLKNMMGASTAEKVISSVQHLEYAVTDAFNKIIKEKEKKVAVIKGNGQLHDLLMADFIKNVRDSYYIGSFTLDSVAKNPLKTLEDLKKYDLAVVAKPTQPFSEQEKQVLDQYIINGGKTLWLIDAVNIEMDSLYETGTSLAFPRDLNLNDLFFKYGVRINSDLIKDEQATPIKLASGDPGSNTQYQEYFWKYAPFIYPDSDHAVVKNMSGIKLEFANSIDTLKNNITKTVLLQSSQYSKKIGTPTEISLNMILEEASPQDYQGTGLIPVAVLLEGSFKSMYENRILPFKDPSYKTQENESKMIIVSDGDIIKNQLDKNFQPLELGYDKWTNNLFDNKDFLMNSVNYLLDDTGLINIRTKDVDLPMLDREKVYENYSYIQFITVGLPIIILLFFGLLFTYIRKRKYGN